MSVLTADLVLRNGVVRAMDGTAQVAEALAVRRGRVVQAGTDQACLKLASDETRIVDLQGATVIPGLVDPHVHLATNTALGLGGVELRDFFDDRVRSVEEILARLREGRMRSSGSADWISGIGSPMQWLRLQERRLPAKEELDDAVPDRPAFVSFGAHIVVANSEAMRRAGISAATPDPPGGRIERCADSMEPNGVFHESARLLIQRAAGGYDPDAHRRALEAALDGCVRRGVTAVHDIMRYRREPRLYQDLREDGALPVRVQMIYRVIEGDFGSESLADLGLRQGFGDPFLRLGGVKVSVDGGVTGNNAAFYRNDAKTEIAGVLRIEQPELDEVVGRYHQAGVRVCVHAIGDAALDMTLAAFERARAAEPSMRLRHRIEHMGNWACTPERLRLMGASGVTPVPNATFLHYLGREILDTVDTSRLGTMFPYQTLLAGGHRLSFGSDAPSYWPINPLRDIGAAVSRQTRDGFRFAGEEALSVLDGLRMQTSNAAWLGGVERDFGTLGLGKVCDAAILANDPLTMDPVELGNADVLATIVDGEFVFGVDTF